MVASASHNRTPVSLSAHHTEIVQFDFYLRTYYKNTKHSVADYLHLPISYYRSGTGGTSTLNIGYSKQSMIDFHTNFYYHERIEANRNTFVFDYGKKNILSEEIKGGCWKNLVFVFGFLKWHLIIKKDFDEFDDDLFTTQKVKQLN